MPTSYYISQCLSYLDKKEETFMKNTVITVAVHGIKIQSLGISGETLLHADD